MPADLCPHCKQCRIDLAKKLITYVKFHDKDDALNLVSKCVCGNVWGTALAKRDLTSSGV